MHIIREDDDNDNKTWIGGLFCNGVSVIAFDGGDNWVDDGIIDNECFLFEIYF